MGWPSSHLLSHCHFSGTPCHSQECPNWGNKLSGRPTNSGLIPGVCCPPPRPEKGLGGWLWGEGSHLTEALLQASWDGQTTSPVWASCGGPHPQRATSRAEGPLVLAPTTCPCPGFWQHQVMPGTLKVAQTCWASFSRDYIKATGAGVHLEGCALDKSCCPPQTH